VQAIGSAAIAQGHQVYYREAHTLIEELMDATLDERRKKHMADLERVPLLIIDDLGSAPRGAERPRGLRDPPRLVTASL
jgi:DNA replication protein DnaC